MPNITIENVDIGSVILRDATHRDGLLTFAGAATLVEGTILARDSVSLNWVPYVIGGVTNENGIPKGVLTYDVTATGAGNVPIRSMVAGFLVEERLIVDADGDGSNLTAAILDQLRTYGLIAESVKELHILDNQ